MPAATIVDAKPRVSPLESTPIEDAPINLAQVTAELVGELRPRGTLGRILVRRVAAMAVRLERCREYEQAENDHRVRHAEARLRETRLAEVDKAIDWIAHEPATNARILRQSPEGMARLIAMWRDIKDELRPEQDVFRADFEAKFPDDADPKHRLPERVGYWDYHLLARAENLMGRRTSDLPKTRLSLLTDMGYNALAPDQATWVKAEIAKLIDDQIADLQTLLDKFDTTSFEVDRADAAKRALFDPSHEAARARRYESAAERSMYRALWELHQLPADLPNPLALESPGFDNETPAMGSFRFEASTTTWPETPGPKPRTRERTARQDPSMGSFRLDNAPPD